MTQPQTPQGRRRVAQASAWWRRALAQWHWVALAGLLVFWWMRTHPETLEEGTCVELPPLTLSTGERLVWPDAGSETLVLNFWATWCPACRAEIEDLGTVHAGLTAPAQRLVGVSVESSPWEGHLAAVRKLGIAYPVALAPPGLQESFKVEMLPTTYVLDRQSCVREVFVGGISSKALLKAARSASASK